MMVALRGKQLMPTVTQLSEKTKGNLVVPTDLKREGVAQIAESLNLLLADIFALYLKSKSFHWHLSGPHFRDYHLLLDEQASQILAMTDEIAERTRKIGGTTLHSVGDITRHQRLKDHDAVKFSPKEMLAELRVDNQDLTRYLRSAHVLCEQHSDVATASLIETWVDEPSAGHGSYQR